MPNSIEEEAKEFFLKALDWSKENSPIKKERKDFKKIQISDVSEKNFPPCIRKILEGMEGDGKKRALFVLINFFRFIELDRDKLEEIIYSWNKKNKPPIKEGYIQSQISWSYKQTAKMPPNCKSYYTEIGVCNPDQLCTKIKNPVNYIIIKNSSQDKIKKNKNNN